ncbi:MAG: S1C family serine protease [Lachnospiraceae bacterium]|nr:S1C family serine protease [Lachnospiraceae bacterium]MCD8248976.1 S1C family serine protease [Lachnospiraceae bacterium]
MGEDKKDENSNFSFMKEKVKHKPVYQNPLFRKAATAVICGVLFAVAALLVWAFLLPMLRSESEEDVELQPIEIAEEEDEASDEAQQSETEDGEQQVDSESTVYITETISLELEDYEKLYQQLSVIASTVQKSLVNISVVSENMDWFAETFTTQNSVSGMLVGDNGLELLILTEYDAVSGGDEYVVTFYDYTTASATLKKYDRNTGLAAISVNLSDISDSTKEIITYAELGSSKSVRSGQSVLAVGNPLGSYGSVLSGSLTSVTQTASLYDGSYNILTTDIAKADGGSGVLINWSGEIVGLIQESCEVNAQTDTIQAYGISDMKDIIEHLSNSQDIVYMGIIGADVTTSVSESENIPVGVYVSEVGMDSPAFRAGIQPGDIIVSMSGQTVTNLSDIKSILLKCSNDQTIQVVCKRLEKTEYQDLELTVDLKILQ